MDGAFQMPPLPPLGQVPDTMVAQVVRRDRYGDPRTAFQIEEVPTPPLGPHDVLVAVMAAGHPFLTPVKGPLGLSTSLLFDVGVFLLVLGVMVTAINRFSLAEGFPP